MSWSVFSNLVALMVVIGKVNGSLDWTVNKKIYSFGEEVSLLCLVDNCCKQPAGWTKEYFKYHTETIFVDVKDVKFNPLSKYDGRLGHNGFYLIIRNVSEEDLKLSYSCSYGFNTSTSKVLQEMVVFKRHTSPAQILNEETDNKHHQLVIKVVIPIMSFVILILSAPSIYLCIQLYKRHKRKPDAQPQESQVNQADSSDKKILIAIGPPDQSEVNRREDSGNDTSSKDLQVSEETPFIMVSKGLNKELKLTIYSSQPAIVQEKSKNEKCESPAMQKTF